MKSIEWVEQQWICVSFRKCFDLFLSEHIFRYYFLGAVCHNQPTTVCAFILDLNVATSFFSCPLIVIKCFKKRKKEKSLFKHLGCLISGHVEISLNLQHQRASSVRGQIVRHYMRIASFVVFELFALLCLMFACIRATCPVNIEWMGLSTCSLVFSQAFLHSSKYKYSKSLLVSCQSTPNTVGKVSNDVRQLSILD